MSSIIRLVHWFYRSFYKPLFHQPRLLSLWMTSVWQRHVRLIISHSPIFQKKVRAKQYLQSSLWSLIGFSPFAYGCDHQNILPRHGMLVAAVTPLWNFVVLVFGSSIELDVFDCWACMLFYRYTWCWGCILTIMPQRTQVLQTVFEWPAEGLRQWKSLLFS